MRLSQITLLVGSFITSCAGLANAGLVLSIPAPRAAVTADANNEASFTLSVQVATDTGTESLRAYDIFLDIGAVGMNLPDGWTINTPMDVASMDFFSGSTSPSAGNVSASGANTVSAPLIVTKSPTTLWEFSVDVSGNDGATNGAYSASFLTGALNFSVVDGGGNPLSGLTNNPTTVTLQDFTPIPEPSAFCLLGLLSIAGELITRVRQVHLRRDGSTCSRASLENE